MSNFFLAIGLRHKKKIKMGLGASKSRKKINCWRLVGSSEYHYWNISDEDEVRKTLAHILSVVVNKLSQCSLDRRHELHKEDAEARGQGEVNSKETFYDAVEEP
jgi:hypothetical protein